MLAAVACALAPQQSRAADGARSEENGPSPFPATVKVLSDLTYLRAGPGEDFYPTERLTTGHTLEVWAIDPAGYCAVRPVEGSFSWIRGADFDHESRLDSPAGEHTAAAAPPFTGVIVADGAVSRIGSQLNDLRHVAQVSLEAGERVRVIEEVRIPSGRHAGLWARIEPPAGEFRWARLADLEIPPALAPHVPQSVANARAEAATGASASEAITAIKNAGDAIALAVNEARDAAGSGAPTTSTEPPSLEPVPLAKRLFTGWLPMGTSVFDAAPREPPVAVAAGGNAVANDELTDIDLALSLAVTGPGDQWNLPQLRERLRVAAARTTSQSDRLRAEAIDARLTRFEAIQARQRALAVDAPSDPSPLRLGSMWSSLSDIGTRPIRPGVLPGGRPADGQPTWTPPTVMETTGRLATVVSRRPDAPRWAVVDDNNTVLAFVTPQAGVNLAALVGQQVSVRGAQGYMPEYNRPYLVASEARPRIASAPQAIGDATR
jgi:hypothetical protein